MLDFDRGMPLARNLELELEKRGDELLKIARVVTIGAATWGPYPDEGSAALGSLSVVQSVRPSWNENAQLVALGIGYAESRWGVSLDFSFADGTPSWNWGAMVMRGTNGTLKHGDHTADGKPVKWDFAAWNTPEEGFGAWARMMERPGLRNAPDQMAAGNARGVAERMYADCLFSGTCPPSCSDSARIDAYARVIVGAAAHVAKLLGRASGVRMGELTGVPLGKCSWHDARGGGGGGGGGGGDSSTGTIVLVGAAIAGLLLLKG